MVYIFCKQLSLSLYEEKPSAEVCTQEHTSVHHMPCKAVIMWDTNPKPIHKQFQRLPCTKVAYASSEESQDRMTGIKNQARSN